MRNIFSLFFAIALLFTSASSSVAFTNSSNVTANVAEMSRTSNINRFDSNFWKAAKIWHGDMSVKDFAILLKSHCMQESAMNQYAMREEKGYLSGKYQRAVSKSALAIQRYVQTEFGDYQSQYTIEIDLSRSYGLVQIMGERAYELGWRGESFYSYEDGLMNVDIGLYYGAKLININLKRYNYDVTKAISAYNAGSYTKSNSGYVKNVKANMIKFAHDFDNYIE